jgi:2-methylcitrate dehydratase PrpD
VVQAALVNGTASHALDYDDVQYAWCVHTSVSILPALLALAERDARSGPDVITALVAGVETACRIAQYVTEAHRARGHHATGTLGTFGAAAASARLLGLGADESATALGIAAAQAAGLRAMFGTMGKPLHAGKAAANGLYAALLASRGFSARGDAIECSQGFADTLSPLRAPDGVLEGLGNEFRIREVLFKHHAACYSAHASIDAAARVRAAHDIDPRHIEAVEVRVAPESLKVCDIRTPITGLEAKFSVGLATAMALSGRNTAAIGTFSDEACADPELVALRERTHVVGDRALRRGVSEVVVTMMNGDVRRHVSEVGTPESDLEAQGRRLRDKFLSLATPVIGCSRAHEAIGLIDGLEHVDRVDAIVRCSVPPTLIP